MKIISQTATTTTVEVVTNEVASFVGHQYIVNAVELTGGDTFDLLELNGDPTGLSVQDIALVSDAVTYNAEEVSAANAALDGAIAIGAEIPGTGTPADTYTEAGAAIPGTGTDPVYYTDEECDDHNATLPGAVHAGEPIQ